MVSTSVGVGGRERHWWLIGSLARRAALDAEGGDDGVLGDASRRDAVGRSAFARYASTRRTVLTPGWGFIFARTRLGAAELAEALLARGFAAEALHGDLGQEARESVLRKLSPRELEVLAKMAEGRTNPAIARALFMSESTVEKHVSAIFSKLNLSEETEIDRRVAAVLAFLREADSTSPG